MVNLVLAASEAARTRLTMIYSPVYEEKQGDGASYEGRRCIYRCGKLW